MKVLVIGATGLIGAAVVARLTQEGHEVTGMARNVAHARRRLPGVRWIRFDLARALSPEVWLPHLERAEAVVNCAGILQDAPGETLRGLHEDGAGALYEACERSGISRVIQLSAIGLDHATPTRFSRAKLTGDELLMQRSLDWVILRPSVVVGRAAYGGSAMFRGLAALPVLPVMPDTAPLQIVQLDQVAKTVCFFCRPEAPALLTLDLAGPERMSLTEVVAAYRQWLGWPRARLIRLPSWAASALYSLGDFAALLGWRPPLRSTVRGEIARGATGDPSEWTRMTGIAPLSLHDALAAEPSSVQERWFAGLYFLKAVLFVVLPLFWIATGLISLGPGFEAGVALMQAGETRTLSAAAVMAGGIADILIGLAIAFRRTARLGLYAALIVTLFYLAAGTLLLPELWLDPLGRLLKALPILVLNLVAIAILEDR